MPHAPLLVPELESDEVAAGAARIRAACAAIRFDVELVVVLSPHAASSCVYERVCGSLQPFGVSGVEVDAVTDDAAARYLADEWGAPLVAEPVDHGIVVPMCLLERVDAPVVAAGIAERVDVSETIRAGREFARAVSALAQAGPVAFLASVNTSAGLSSRAPLPGLRGAGEVERSALAALDSDPEELKQCAEDLARSGGSCSSGPLTAFAELLGGRRSRLTAYEAPVGVGYAVAVTE